MEPETETRHYTADSTEFNLAEICSKMNAICSERLHKSDLAHIEAAGKIDYLRTLRTAA